MINKDAEIKREKQKEKKKSKSSNKIEEPTIEDLQNKFLTKPLPIIKF